MMPDPKHFHQQKFQHFAQCGTVLSQVWWGLNILHFANFKHQNDSYSHHPFPFNKNRIQTFPLPFPACNVRFNGAFCPSLACGTTLRFGSRPRSRHDGATPWGPALQLCLGAASKPCKVLKVLVADWFIAHFDILRSTWLYFLRLHYMITSAYHNYMNYLGESCVLVASQGIICKYMYVRILWININMKKYKDIYIYPDKISGFKFNLLKIIHFCLHSWVFQRSWVVKSSSPFSLPVLQQVRYNDPRDMALHQHWQKTGSSWTPSQNGIPQQYTIV